MPIETRGGAPVIRRFTAANSNAITTTGQEVDIRMRDVTGFGARGPFVTKWVQISNEGSNVLRVYFTLVDFNANDTDGFIDLPATTGFYEGPAETTAIWLRGVGGSTDVVLIGYARRG